MLKEHKITLGKKDLLLMEEVLTMLGMLSTLSWLSGALVKSGIHLFIALVGSLHIKNILEHPPMYK